jgi:uroporphyrin-3 C-methyltransferase
MNPDSADTSPPAAPASPPASSTAAPPATGAAKLRASRWAGAGLVLLLVAAGVWAWLDVRRDDQAFRAEVARRLGAADTALAQAKTQSADLGNALRDAQAKSALLESRLAESESQQASLEALYRELAPSRDELALTEAEQVLVLASQQLALAGNVQAALAALQLADAKLGRMDLPRLAPLRRSLARDMDELKAVPYVDVPGIAAKLDSALAAIDTLPLARDERLPASTPEAPQGEEAGWRRFLRELWSDVRSLVRIEVSDRPAAPLVTPSQAYFLRENLRLRLLAARLALLSRDHKSFNADLAAANAWLAHYFDARTKPVQSLSATLAQLAATPLPAAVPDLSRSLDLVRTLRMARVDPPEPASAVPPEPAPAVPARGK